MKNSKTHKTHDRRLLHVVIIPDGNRRWAKGRGLKPWEGHRAAGSEEHMRSLLEEAQKLGITHLTFWGFSTENWERDKKEIEEVFSLIYDVLCIFEEELVKRKIRFRHIGRKDRLPKKIVRKIGDLENTTRGFGEHNVQLCLDYGGRDEIVRAVGKIIQSGKKEVSEQDIIDSLDTKDIPDPGLIIRTSGEHRTSGFMPFQSSYAELYFAPMHFPDFKSEDLRKAVLDFMKRKRNFGK